MFFEGGLTEEGGVEQLGTVLLVEDYNAFMSVKLEGEPFVLRCSDMSTHVSHTIAEPAKNHAPAACIASVQACTITQWKR